MKNIKKWTALFGVCALAAGSLAACGEKNTETTAPAADTASEETTAPAADTASEEATDAQSDAAEEGTADISGSISMAGSTSMEKLANAVAEAFMEKYPQVTVNAEFTGSSAGIESLLAGSVDIGNSSRNLKDSEKEAGAVENIVAIDGIAVVVNPSTNVDNLTKEQLVQIYTGEITDWADVDGDSAPIVVIGREAGSGTRGAFEELLEIEDSCAYASELDSTGAVVAKVASTPGAIGYVSLDVLDDTVKPLSLEGVEPTAENIKAGNYFLSRPFVMATKGEISEQSPAVQELFAYLSSDEGKELISSVGLITVD
ncbi:MAG: phosphate ABC transporter substrate-binding protein [Lachnospiraceae bacterium]|nr:phosphate ABC transporter substrate-binding protein [Lachnospiraceae bacterium]